MLYIHVYRDTIQDKQLKVKIFKGITMNIKSWTWNKLRVLDPCIAELFQALM